MIYEVPLGQINEMADISADAFIAMNDPIGNFMFQNEPDHLTLKKRFFRSLATSCSPKAIRQATSPKMEAISIWFPPGMDHSEDVDVDPFNEYDFQDKNTITRMRDVSNAIGELTEHLGREPQWYLHLVAVQPPFMGKGYSSQLIRPMLAKAKSDGLPCTLITQIISNVKKYECWGFKVVKEMTVQGSHEKFYSMRKD